MWNRPRVWLLSVATVLLVLLPAASALAVPPSNDLFANATVLGAQPVSVSQTTVDATEEVGEPLPCYGIGNTVWFRYTAVAGGSLVAETNGSSFDTVLVAYTGSSLPTLTEIDCDDDDGAGLQSWMEFDVVAGTTYWFQVGGYYDASGPLTFNLRQTEVWNGSIIVKNVVSPADAPAALFSFDPSWSPVNFPLAGGGSADFSLLPAGIYSVAEVLPLGTGWSLESATCDDGSSPGAIGVSPGETVTCTFTNLYSQETQPPGGLCLGMAPTITGTAGADTLVGTPGDDVIVGLDGDDVIYGLGGNDRICGGLGADWISGGAGNDRIRSGRGADTLRGTLGNDLLGGGAGIDSAHGGRGTDTCLAETMTACE